MRGICLNIKCQVENLFWAKSQDFWKSLAVEVIRKPK